MVALEVENIKGLPYVLAKIYCDKHKITFLKRISGKHRPIHNIPRNPIYYCGQNANL